jgi:predicted MFS family arabinose efflux permease
VLKTGPGGYGALLTANGVGALIGALTVASMGHRVSRRVLVFGGLSIFSAMLFLLAFTENFYVALVLLAIGGWGMLLFFSTVNTLLQLDSSDEMRGRVMSISADWKREHFRTHSACAGRLRSGQSCARWRRS